MRKYVPGRLGVALGVAVLIVPGSFVALMAYSFFRHREQTLTELCRLIAAARSAA